MRHVLNLMFTFIVQSINDRMTLMGNLVEDAFNTRIAEYSDTLTQEQTNLKKVG